jgi:rubrerythrin
METDGNHEVAGFFNMMATLEQRHRDQLSAQRHELFGDTPPRHSSRAVFEVEQPSYDDMTGELSLEQAFELAMDAERRAGEYYGEALEYASEPQVVSLFESLKRSEQDHLRMLQVQRDRAFA